MSLLEDLQAAGINIGQTGAARLLMAGARNAQSRALGNGYLSSAQQIDAAKKGLNMRDFNRLRWDNTRGEWMDGDQPYKSPGDTFNYGIYGKTKSGGATTSPTFTKELFNKATATRTPTTTTGAPGTSAGSASIPTSVGSYTPGGAPLPTGGTRDATVTTPPAPAGTLPPGSLPQYPPGTTAGWDPFGHQAPPYTSQQVMPNPNTFMLPWQTGNMPGYGVPPGSPAVPAGAAPAGATNKREPGNESGFGDPVETLPGQTGTPVGGGDNPFSWTVWQPGQFQLPQFKQQYGGQPAPYPDLSEQIKAAMGGFNLMMPGAWRGQSALGGGYYGNIGAGIQTPFSRVPGAGLFSGNQFTTPAFGGGAPTM